MKWNNLGTEMTKLEMKWTWKKIMGKFNYLCTRTGKWAKCIIYVHYLTSKICLICFLHRAGPPFLLALIGIEINSHYIKHNHIRGTHTDFIFKITSLMSFHWDPQSQAFLALFIVSQTFRFSVNHWYATLSHIIRVHHINWYL